jgi:phosphoglycerol transferase MdoB-like AlkP superfamily enzyme
VADKIAEIVQEASGPVFVFAITMENHGPLHLEQVAPSDMAELYSVPPPEGCDDLTIYLRHLRNADRMAAKLRTLLSECERSASLCWFGDHVPIMPSVYESFGVPNGEVEYVLWQNSSSDQSGRIDMSVCELAIGWLSKAGVC